MKSDIVTGEATLIAVEKTIDRATVLGWALPGGGFTSDPVRAQAVAGRMADMIRAGKGRRRREVVRPDTP